MKYFKILGIALCMLMLTVGMASAVILPNATTETTSNGVITSVQCNGVVLASEEYATEQTNQALDGAPLAKGEVYGAAVYTNKLMAVNGATSFVKTTDVNSKNSLLGQSNIATSQQLAFVAGNGGQATGAEQISTFNAGTTTAADKTLCPFTNADAKPNSPFNTMVQDGMTFDVTQVQLATQVSATTLGKTSDIPLSVNYNVDAEGQGTITAYTNVFSQDSRGDGTVTKTTKDTTGNTEYMAIGALNFIQNQYLTQKTGNINQYSDIDQGNANLQTGTANGAVGGKGGNADASATANGGNANAVGGDGSGKTNNDNHYNCVPVPTTNGGDANAIGGNANAIATAVAGSGGNGGNGGIVDNDNNQANIAGVAQIAGSANIGANVAIQNINLPSNWVVGTDGKVYAPVKTVSPVTPSSNVAYKDSTTATGSFKFAKTMKFTSGIAA
jgi:hypothetical protein